MTTLQLKHIFIIYSHNVECVVNSIIEHYNTESYDGTLFVINQYISEDQLIKERRLGNFKKYIYYNLEHIYLRKLSFDIDNPAYIDYHWGGDYSCGSLSFNQYDEIWDFLLENEKFYPDYARHKYRFMPMRYNTFYEDRIIKKKDPKYDLAFLGICNTPTRYNMMNLLTQLYLRHGVTSINLIGQEIDDLRSILEQTKYVLDYPHYSDFLNSQNCVRIFENILWGNDVICCLNKKGRMDYFEDIIKTVDLNLGYNLYDAMYQTTLHPPVSLHNQYKALTYRQEDYENYKKQLIKKYKLLYQ